MSASFDLDYELDDLQSGALDWVFGYDDTGNILSIADQAIPANDQTFVYDDLYRLDTAAGIYGNEDFDYDANGNRTNYTDGVVNDAYTYEPLSSRLATQDGWTFSRDGAGNRTEKLNGSGYGQLFGYGDHNRLSMVTDRDAGGDTVVGTYVFDGRGQRVSKTAGGVTTHFIYGLNGELLGEYVDVVGIDLSEYVYLNGQPIAQEAQEVGTYQPPGLEYFIDNGDPDTSSNGSWRVKTNSQSNGVGYMEGKKKATNTYRWTWNQGFTASTHDVYAWWVAKNGYSSQVDYTISYQGGAATDVVTKSHKTGGGQWQFLGNYQLQGTGNEYVEIDAANGKVSADAIRFVEVHELEIIDLQNTYFIHSDHLGTTRAVSDDTQTAIWRWDSTPFGDSAPDEDPDGDSNYFIFNLRFPGQYYDQESGLHYNYFRDYDPGTGRYVESDPIGLGGGNNTYLYTTANPLLLIDPEGLFPPIFRWRTCNAEEKRACINYCDEVIGRPFESCRARIGFRKNIGTIDYYSLPNGLSCSCQDEDDSDGEPICGETCKKVFRYTTNALGFLVLTLVTICTPIGS